jgi:Stage II sporulation protein E (SpoIIE)
MAQLRFTIPTLASLGYDPAAILHLAANDLDIGKTGHFATVHVGLIEDRRKLTVASAGHFPLLLISGQSAEFVRVKVGVPLGVRNGDKMAIKEVVWTKNASKRAPAVRESEYKGPRPGNRQPLPPAWRPQLCLRS